MSNVNTALALAAKGFHVFPLVPGTKFPLQEDFPNRATRDETKIRQMWNAEVGTDPLWHAANNVGIYTGRFGDPRADGTYESLCVIDVDNKDGKNGSQTLADLRAQGLVTPPTYVQTTPTGGRHYVYRTNTPVSNSAGSQSSGLGVGLDIRGTGGFLLGAGSIVAAGTYCAHELPVAVADASLIERCKRHVPRSQRASTPMAAIDETAATARVREYLRTARPAVSGAGGNTHTFTVAAQCKDYGTDADTTFALMIEPEGWNDRCQPPWDDYELERIVQNAYAHGRSAQGSAAPEALFTPVAAPEIATLPGAALPPSDHPVNKLNNEHALVFIGGDHYVLWETKDAESHFDLRYLSESAFIRLHAGQSLPITKGDKTAHVPVAKLWLEAQPKPAADALWRRTYKGVWYMPGKDAPEGFYNVWRGFSCEPHPKDAEVPKAWQQALDDWRGHILQNVCNGSAELAHWLTGWLAHLVQRPWEKPLTAIVVQGDKGTGKTSTFDRVADLFGKHAMVVHDRRFLLSQFNGHLESLSLLVLDEALWAGDKEGEGKLKGIITGSHHAIERKGKEIYKVRNLTRVVMIGNASWLTPASADERRYAVFNVGNGRQKDKPFFERQRQVMQSGGAALLLRYLLDFDLSTVDVNEAPNTDGLARQKLLSLEPIQAWWYSSLLEGTLVGAGLEDGWINHVPKKAVRAAIKGYHESHQIRGQLPHDGEVTDVLKKMCPTITDRRGPRDKASHKQPYQYVLPSLEVARAAFSAVYGMVQNWD